MKTVLFALSLSTFLSTLSCSPAADPIGKASAHYQVDFPQSPGLKDTGQCNKTGIAAIAQSSDTVAELPAAGTDRLPTEFGVPVVDGEGGDQQVECTVKRIDGGYKLDIDLRGPNRSPHAGNATGETRLQLEGSITDAGIGTGQVILYTTATFQLTPNTECQFRAIPLKEDATQFEVSPGEAKFVFTCPDTTSSLADLSTCETRGTIWVTDCLD